VAEGLLLAMQFVNIDEVILVFYALMEMLCTYTSNAITICIFYHLYLCFEPAPVDYCEHLIQVFLIQSSRERGVRNNF
jgi:hypothetical protein